MRQDTYLKSLISQHCCDSENDGLNTRVNGSIAIVRTTESLLELKNVLIFSIICLKNQQSQWFSWLELWNQIAYGALKQREIEPRRRTF